MMITTQEVQVKCRADECARPWKIAENDWCVDNPRPGLPVLHGYCPACFAAVMAGDADAGEEVEMIVVKEG